MLPCFIEDLDAGMALGISLMQLPWKVTGVTLAGPMSYYQQQEADLKRAFAALFGRALATILFFPRASIEVALNWPVNVLIVTGESSVSLQPYQICTFTLWPIKLPYGNTLCRPVSNLARDASPSSRGSSKQTGCPVEGSSAASEVWKGVPRRGSSVRGGQAPPHPITSLCFIRP